MCEENRRYPLALIEVELAVIIILLSLIILNYCVEDVDEHEDPNHNIFKADDQTIFSNDDQSIFNIESQNIPDNTPRLW